MEKRTSIFARIFAIVALAAAVVAVLLIVSGAVEDSDKKSGNKTHQQSQHKQPRTTKAIYVVKPGDTLTAIAGKTGIPVTELKELNPEVDPQILVEGEKLKLR